MLRLQEVWYTFKLTLKMDSNQGAVLLLSGARNMPTLLSKEVTERVKAFSSAGKAQPTQAVAAPSANSRSVRSARGAPIPAAAPVVLSYVDRLLLRPEKR